MNKIIILITAFIFFVFGISYYINSNFKSSDNLNSLPTSIINNISSTVKTVYFESKLINTRFHPPSDITGKYTSLYNGTIEEINFYKGLRMTISIALLPATDTNCKETSAKTNNYSSYGKQIYLGGKIPLYFILNDRDGRKGYQAADAVTRVDRGDKIICVNVHEEISNNGDTEGLFDQILTNASSM